MALSASYVFIAGLIFGGALSAPHDLPSSISETQVPSLQSRVLPVSTNPIPTQPLLSDSFDKSDLNDSSASLALPNDGISSPKNEEDRSPTEIPRLRGLEPLSKLEKRKDEDKTTAAPSTPATKEERMKGNIRDDETYMVYDADKVPCVMAYFKATITVSYPTDLEKKIYERVSFRPPNNKLTVSGTCDRDSQKATMDLDWDLGTLTLKFAYDTLIDSWYVGEFTFKFDTSNPKYKGAETKENVLVKSVKNKRFWTTSHARSFRCLLLHDVIMKDKKNQYSGIIHFDEARVQALAKTDTFKTPKHCIHRVHRDEMVPVAVGGSLAAFTLLTVVGYGIFRYIKVKKYQYNTME